MGSDRIQIHIVHQRGISIHAPRVGSDFHTQANQCQDGISIHAPRVGSDPAYPGGPALAAISIHAPRVGSDRQNYLPGHEIRDFNPRSPCGERPGRGRVPAGENLFQSTLPVWGATPPGRGYRRISCNFNPRSPCGERQSDVGRSWPGRMYFNPRSPCGERPGPDVPGLWSPGISIHAPRVGSDTGCQVVRLVVSISIHAPRVGSDDTGVIMLPPRMISIHAPRVGSDWRHRPHFNPRSPCGERLLTGIWATTTNLFQSTLPVWGATAAF